MAANMKDMKFSHFIFSDIDHIPDSTLHQYYLTPPEDTFPMTLAALGTRWQNEKQYHASLSRKTKIKPFMGAVCSFTGKMFEKVNGYPNNYYGWGGEDDDLLLRCHRAAYSIAYPKNGRVIDLEQVDDKTIDPTEKNKYLKENKLGDMSRYEKILLSETNSMENGLSIYI